MAEEIVNRVAKSPLKTIDLEEFYPAGKRVVFDIKDWLYEGIILREKEFRAFVQEHDWRQYQDNYVALTCSEDAIIPSWAYMLIASELAPFVKKVVVGDLTLLETSIFQEIIGELDIQEYENKPVIIKGCADKPIPESAFSFLIQRLQPVVKSMMYGEACSTVPLYKMKK
ncbi:MAG: hypothetical protein CMB99_03045 [Flavobacteriaceae bacterium]|nr:hypothetical protein [Flavobacteriaceae bacterium]|tara:strand:+ start:80270 stop:80779 length:510 start_codon:yes stop_codon:yes gene_type:complete